MPINALCGCGCGKLTRKRDAYGNSMCTAAKRRRSKLPIEAKVAQDSSKLPIEAKVAQDSAKDMFTLLRSVGMPRTRQKKKTSAAAQVRQKLLKFMQDNAHLKLEVACRTEELGRATAEVARVSGELAVLRRRFLLMEDTRDWAACARMNNSSATLPATVGRRFVEAHKSSRSAH